MNQWQRTGQQLRRRQLPSGKKPIDEMNLDEALDAEQKYLKWASRNPDHEEFALKQHLYEHYLIPRIDMLQQHKMVSTTLGIDSQSTTD